MMENKNDGRFKPSRSINKEDPTLQKGQIYINADGVVERLYNQRNGKNYWMEGKGVNGINGRCNNQFRADRNGLVIPSEPIAWGKYAQGLPSTTLVEFIKIADNELHGNRTESVV